MATIESSILEAALKTLTATCGQVSTLVLAPSKKGTFIQVSTNGNLGIVSIPYTIEGLKQPVEVAPDVLVSLTKGRGDVTLTASNSGLMVKAGSYKGEANTVEHEGFGMNQLEGAKAFDVDSDLQLFLNKVLPKLRIEKTHASLSDVMVYGKISKGKAFLISYDAYQMCFVQLKTKLPNSLEFHFPYAKLSQLIKDVQGLVRVQYTSDVIEVRSKMVRAQLALPEMDSDSIVSPEDLIERSQSTKNVKGSRITLSKDDLDAFISNSTSLVSSGSGISFITAKGKTKLNLNTPKGRAQVTLSSESNKDSEFSLDLRFVRMIIDKSSEDKVTFDVVKKEGYVVCGDSSFCYVAVLDAGEDQQGED